MNTKTFPRAEVLKRYGQKDGSTTPPAPATPPANTPPADTVVGMDELNASIKSAVDAAVKALQPAPPAPAPAAPPAPKPSFTAEAVKSMVDQAVKDALVNAAKTDTAPKAPDVQSIVDAAVKAAFEGQKRGNKLQQNAEDANHGQRIEIPTGWCKGNLPLHGRELLNICMKRAQFQDISEADVKRGDQLGDGILSRYKQPGYVADGKALTSTGSNAGDELVPTTLSSEIMRRMYLASDLLAALLPGEIDMPTNPFKYPLMTTRPTFLLEAVENTSATDSSPGTAEIILTAKKLMSKVLFSYEVNEDAIISILPALEQVLAEAAAATWESVILNGDVTSTHMDSDTETGAKSAERATAGLRKLALAVTALKADLSTGGISAANLLSMKGLMGKYGINTKNLLLVLGIKGYNTALGLSEVLTAEKAGPNATILTGKLASIYGIPIICSAAARENLNASGVYDGSTTTKGSVILFNRTQFLLGRRRDFTIETDKDIETQTNVCVASFRRAMQPMETPAAAVQSVVIGYNYTA